MSGDISRDFGASLSKLHYEVETLKKQNKQLTTIVEELVSKMDRSDATETRKQRSRVLRAAASQNREEIDSLSSQTSDVAERELLRMFRPLDQPATLDIKVDPRLLENFRRDGGTTPEPEPEVKIIPYVETAAYRDAVQKEIQQATDKSMSEYHSRRQEIERARHHESRNIMRRLSPLWRTDED